MPTPCFMCSPTDTFRLDLRRYAGHPIESPCPRTGSYGYHDATLEVGEAVTGTAAFDALADEWVTEEHRLTGCGYGTHTGRMREPEWFAAHKAEFPVACECGYAFVDEDEWQINWHNVWKRDDTGELIGTSPHKFPPGAMYWSPWHDHFFVPQLAHCLAVVLPDGTAWVIDSAATNCGMPDDHRQERHHCWVLEGTPPNVTVSKNGATCAAGGGSIQSGGYHGMLQGGVLT